MKEIIFPQNMVYGTSEKIFIDDKNEVVSYKNDITGIEFKRDGGENTTTIGDGHILHKMSIVDYMIITPFQIFNGFKCEYFKTKKIDEKEEEIYNNIRSVVYLLNIIDCFPFDDECEELNIDVGIIIDTDNDYTAKVTVINPAEAKSKKKVLNIRYYAPTANEKYGYYYAQYSHGKIYHMVLINDFNKIILHNVGQVGSDIATDSTDMADGQKIRRTKTSSYINYKDNNVAFSYSRTTDRFLLYKNTSGDNITIVGDMYIRNRFGVPSLFKEVKDTWKS